MSTPLIGTVIMFAGNFAPRGWALCKGQLLPISSNTALFSLLGTTYGGDGRTTFGLPDLQGRAPIGEGHGAGLSQRRLGSKLGSEFVTLNNTQIPSHTHAAQTTVTHSLTLKTGSEAEESNPATHVPATGTEDLYGSAGSTTMASNAVTSTIAATTVIGSDGGNQPHTNIQPSLALNFIIALQGLFPSRS